jgi:hypothetical protein
MSDASEFWRYAEEAMLSARQCETNDESQAQLDLAHTWTQAALRSEDAGAINYCPPSARALALQAFAVAAGFENPDSRRNVRQVSAGLL